MNYIKKINTLVNSLKKQAYPQGNLASTVVTFPSNPDNPSASQQIKLFNTTDTDVPFCAICKSKKVIKDGNEYVCKECNTRFSDTHFQFNNTLGSRETGLLDLDHAGEQSPKYHTDHQIGAGSASVSWGKGDRS